MILPACAKLAQDKKTKLPSCRGMASALELLGDPCRVMKGAATVETQTGAGAGLGGARVATVSGAPEKVPS